MVAKKAYKKIVVTGSLGHIGSALIRGFSSDSVGKVVMIDNLSTQRYASLFNLPKKIDYEFYENDIRKVDFKEHLKGADVLVHLAAITDAPLSKDRPEETFEVNLNGTKRVADACLEAGVPFFFPSTTSVYWSQAERVDETCGELEPQSPYADSKLQAEQYLSGLKEKGFKFVICRFGTIFGYSVGMRFHTAVNKFTWQAMNGQPLSVWKTAWQQKRPYLYLGDCIRAINFILENHLFKGELYNVLTDNFTVEDIVNTIKEFVSNAKVDYVDSPIMNQLSYEVDDAKFRKTGFAPQGRLKEGVGETVAALDGVRRKNV